MSVGVEWCETFLAVPVDIVGKRVTGLLRRLEERREEWALRRTSSKQQRASVTPIVIAA
jgi:hypothetical protein